MSEPDAHRLRDSPDTTDGPVGERPDRQTGRRAGRRSPPTTTPSRTTASSGRATSPTESTQMLAPPSTTSVLPVVKLLCAEAR